MNHSLLKFLFLTSGLWRVDIAEGSEELTSNVLCCLWFGGHFWVYLLINLDNAFGSIFLSILLHRSLRVSKWGCSIVYDF